MTSAAILKGNIASRFGGALKLHRGAAFGEVSITTCEVSSHENQVFTDDGTALAIKYLILGDAAHSTSKPGRGGARNHANRSSEAISAKQVSNLLAAASHARAIEMPLNRMITIHWKLAGVPLEGMAKATGRFTDLLGKALARYGYATAWLWTHENGPNKGGHCHLLVHVPRHLVAALAGLQKRWLKAITGSPYRTGVILSRPIGGRLGLEVNNPDLHAVNLASALNYVLKGADQQAAKQFQLSRLEPGGRIIGKRCSTSQNIGAAAREIGRKA